MSSTKCLGVVEMAERLAKLEAERDELELERNAAENRLEYERNRFERIMAGKDAAIAAALGKKLELELDALREIADHVDEAERRRMLRRLQRIDDIVGRFA